MEVPAMSNTYQKKKASKEYGLYNKCKKLNDDELFRLLDDRNSLKRISSARVLQLRKVRISRSFLPKLTR
ncbi:hypothetical protein C5Y85_25090 [Escherichia coli]|nr:hypothetical protein C5P09_25500 [Escherichia coli]PQK24143.1 hypothetical protein C5Y85_25090 [Escherichia coli]